MTGFTQFTNEHEQEQLRQDVLEMEARISAKRIDIRKQQAIIAALDGPDFKNWTASARTQMKDGCVRQIGQCEKDIQLLEVAAAASRAQVLPDAPEGKAEAKPKRTRRKAVEPVAVEGEG